MFVETQERWRLTVHPTSVYPTPAVQ